MGQAAQVPRPGLLWSFSLLPYSIILPPSIFLSSFGFRPVHGHMVHEQAAGYRPGGWGWGVVHSGILEPPCVCSTVKGGVWQRSPVSGAQAFCYSIRAR